MLAYAFFHRCIHGCAVDIVMFHCLTVILLLRKIFSLLRYGGARDRKKPAEVNKFSTAAASMLGNTTAVFKYHTKEYQNFPVVLAWKQEMEKFLWKI